MAEFGPVIRGEKCAPISPARRCALGGAASDDNLTGRNHLVGRSFPCAGRV